MNTTGAITVLNFLLIFSGIASSVMASCEETRSAGTSRCVFTVAVSGPLHPGSATFVTTGKHEHLVASGCKRVGFANPQIALRPSRLGLIAVSASLAIRGREAQLHAQAIPTLHEVLRV